MSLRYLGSYKKKTTNQEQQPVCRKRDSKAASKAAILQDVAKRGGSPALTSRKQQHRQGPQAKNMQTKQQNKRKWVQEFTHSSFASSQVSPNAPNHLSQNHQGGLAENNLKRRRIFVDIIELQHYGGLALCSNHIVNFKIGKY